MSHLIRENIYPFLIPLFVYLYFFPDLPRWKKMTFFVVGILIPIDPQYPQKFFRHGIPFFFLRKIYFDGLYRKISVVKYLSRYSESVPV